jgi:Na+-driven multidrug efflux pump
MTMVSIWGVRITMMLILVGRMGLTGAWIAMACELAFRGAIFLIRLDRGKWLEIKV